jgi:3-oxoacyl-[acyl-carrier-protein] synthase-3
MLKAAIKGVSSYLPSSELTNEQLALEFGDMTPQKITDKTGISSRHIAASGECSSDLGAAAAARLFESGVCSPSDIDFLVLCTQTPDYLLPTTACIVQDRLGLSKECGAVDVNQGCSGYIYSLALAKSLVEAGTAQNVLLVTSDTYSKLINARDKTLRTLFGDGAAATLISGVQSDRDLIGPFVFGTDGSGAKDLIVPAGGLRQPVNDVSREEHEDGQGNWRSACNIYMDGGAVYNFAMQAVPATIERLLEKCGMTLEEVDYLIPHQANKFMLDRLRARLRFPAEKFYNDLGSTGNTVSSTIPIALESCLNAGNVTKGQKVALVGFGVGLSWGAAMIEIV